MTRTNPNPSPMDPEEVRAALQSVNLRPKDFVGLVIKYQTGGGYHDGKALASVLYTLRAQIARDQHDGKALKRPSPIEHEYQIDLDDIERQLKRQVRSRANQTSAIVTRKSEPNTKRYFALMNLLGDDGHPIAGTRQAKRMVIAVRTGEFNRDAFELLVNAMHEQFLDVDDRENARHLASKMFRQCDPIDFELDVQALRSRYETDSDEAVFEDYIDKTYGVGTYSSLTAGW